MLILNILIYKWDAVKSICLHVDFSEVFLKGLYITLSLKRFILWNSCSAIACAAKQILELALFVNADAKNPVKEVALSELSCHDRCFAKINMSVIFMQAVWFNISSTWRKVFPGDNVL